MAEEQKEKYTSPVDASHSPNKLSNPPSFNPNRMIGIIKRKALLNELVTAYQAECLAYYQEHLELQKKQDEPFLYSKVLDDSRKDMTKPTSRLKKAH